MFDENLASALCYTSGTTGNPKGVLQSHRSAVLHSFCLMSADTMAISTRDSLLLCAPLFHVNCWGIPFAAAGTGAKMVLPGMKMDGASLFELIRDEGSHLLRRGADGLAEPVRLDGAASQHHRPAWPAS